MTRSSTSGCRSGRQGRVGHPNRDHVGDPNRDHGDPNRDRGGDPNRDREGAVCAGGHGRGGHENEGGTASCVGRGGPAPRGGPTRRAGVLLEVVVAMTIVVASLGLLGAQLSSSLKMMTWTEEQLRASQLADRLLAMVELDAEIQQRVLEAGEQGLEEEFGDDVPGYFWRVRVEPAERENPDLEDLALVTLEVLHQPDRTRPDSIDGAEVVRRLGMLRAAPAELDLAALGLGAGEELPPGLSPDIAGQLDTLIGLLGGFDSPTVSIHQLIAQVDQQTLQAFLPLIQSVLAAGGVEGLQAGLSGILDGGGLPGGLLPGGQLPGGQPGQPAKPPGGMGPGGVQVVPPNAPPPGGRGGRPGRGGAQPGTPPGRPPAGRAPRGGGNAAQPPDGPRPTPGGGSGPGGSYTIEDLIRMRDEYNRQQQGGG